MDIEYLTKDAVELSFQSLVSSVKAEASDENGLVRVSAGRVCIEVWVP